MSKEKRRCIFDRESLRWHQGGVPCSGEITKHHAPLYKSEGGRETLPCCRGHQDWLHSMDTNEWRKREGRRRLWLVERVEESVKRPECINRRDKRGYVRASVHYY